MKYEETMRPMYDRLMLLISDIRSLGSNDCEDSKVTKKLLRAFTLKNPNLAIMIRRDPNYYHMTPNQLLSEMLHQEVVDLDVEKSLSWTLCHHIGEGWMGRGYHLGMPTLRTHQLFLKPQRGQSSDQVEFTQAREKVKA
jgi:hypothetical protein